MTANQKMKNEMHRVRHMLSAAVADLEAEGGDVRFFNAAFLSCALQLTVEVEGIAALERAVAKIGAREMVRAGAAGRA